MQVTGLIIAIILFLAGIAGTLVPALPGPVLVWLGMVIYGFLEGFERLDTLFFLVQTGALGLIFLMDYLAVALGTKRFGGSKYAIVGALVGLLVGLISLGPPGIIAGPFLGALLVELLAGRPFHDAARVGLGTLLGVLGGTVVKLAVEITMITWFFKKIL